MHGAGLQPNGDQTWSDQVWSYQDEVLDGLSDAHLRCIPPQEEHSVIWNLWHITRIEDACMNVLLADAPQVFHAEAWQAKLNSPFVDVGNAMDAVRVAALSQAIDIPALLAYRLAVGRCTQALAGSLDFAALRKKPAAARLQCLAADGTVPPGAEWLLDYWGGHPASNLLLMPASRHGFVHLNEIASMRARLRRAVGAG